MQVRALLSGYSSSSSSSASNQAEEADAPMRETKKAVAPAKKLFSIKGALALIDHGGEGAAGEEEDGAKRQMKLSRKEQEMQGTIRAKMRFAGETYHSVPAPEIAISKQMNELLDYRYAAGKAEGA